MRTKLDAVMERLYSGHEHTITLQANIGSAQDHAGAPCLCDHSCLFLIKSRRCERNHAGAPCLLRSLPVVPCLL